MNGRLRTVGDSQANAKHRFSSTKIPRGHRKAAWDGRFDVLEQPEVKLVLNSLRGQ